jgi:tetratricopeptide (TPR) repeat protein
MSSGDGEESSSPTTQKQRVKTVTQATTVEGDPTTVIQTTTAESEPPPENSGQGGGKVSYDEAVALTDESTALMDEGNYEDALPLALQAHKSLRNSGELYEAYAAYNAGKSYIELGDCNKGLPLLDESEAIQGERSEIEDARAQCDGG